MTCTRKKYKKQDIEKIINEITDDEKMKRHFDSSVFRRSKYTALIYTNSSVVLAGLNDLNTINDAICELSCSS